MLPYGAGDALSNQLVVEPHHGGDLARGTGQPDLVGLAQVLQADQRLGIGHAGILRQFQQQVQGFFINDVL